MCLDLTVIILKKNLKIFECSLHFFYLSSFSLVKARIYFHAKKKQKKHGSRQDLFLVKLAKFNSREIFEKGFFVKLVLTKIKDIF